MVYKVQNSLLLLNMKKGHNVTKGMQHDFCIWKYVSCLWECELKPCTVFFNKCFYS